MKTLSRILYRTESIDAIPIDAVRQSLERDHIACLRGLFKRDAIEAAKASIAGSFAPENDHPTSGNPADFAKRNFQKLRVGILPDKTNVARLLRTFYNPIWAEDIYGMRETFRSLARIRNRLLGEPEHFAIDKEEDGLWTSARIHQYPVGGGFMSAHQDTGASEAAISRGMGYLQLFVSMSAKGIDYEKGGAYVEHNRGRLAVDDFCLPGDIVMYDGAAVHGVAEIDPHRCLDMKTFSGRVVAFANLWGNQ